MKIKPEVKTHRLNERLSNSEISVRGDPAGKDRQIVMQELDQPTSMKPKHIIWVSLKTIVVDAALKTTMHGLPGIFQSKYLLLRLMWIVCLLGSTGVCAYLLIKSVQDYLNYDVVTVTSTIYEIPTVFPVNFNQNFALFIQKLNV